MKKKSTVQKMHFTSNIPHIKKQRMSFAQDVNNSTGEFSYNLPV